MNSSLSTRRLIGSVSAVALMAASAPALAAAASDPADNGDIIVTATKRAQNVQDVPIAITAVTGEQLQAKGILNILSLDQTVPGLTIQNSGNDPSPIIRGAGAAGTADVAVPYYIDGAYQPHSGQALAGFLDLDRVEVLKGPQGTLFGRNTLGGLINVVSKKPVLGRLDFGGAVTIGNYEEHRFEGFINVPLGDKLALRVTGLRENHDPYVVNVALKDGGLKDADETYIRSQLAWEASDRLRITLGYTYWHDTANGNNDYGYKVLGIPTDPVTHQTNGVFGYLDPRQGLRNGYGGGKAATGNISNGDPSAAILPDPYQIAFDYRPRRDILENAASLNVDWRVASHKVQFNASYYDYSELRLTDGELSTAPAFVAGQLTVSKTAQAELNVSSDFRGPLQYTVGLYYYDDARPGASHSAFLFGYTDATHRQTPTWAYFLYQINGGTRSYAAYGQAEYNLTDKLQATAGVRYNRDERRYSSINIDPASEHNPLPSYAGTPTVTSQNSGHVDYKVGVNYRPVKHVLLYGYYATGYIAGGVQQGNTGTLLPPTEVKTFELGAKAQALDGRIQFDAAYYDSDYSGLLTTVFKTIGNTIISQSIPGGSLVSRGFEGTLNVSVTSDFNVNLGIALDRSKFKDFIESNLFAEGGDETVNGQSFFIRNGARPAFSPAVALFMGASYKINLDHLGSLVPQVNAKFSSSYNASNAPYFWSVQPSYTVVSLAAIYNAPDPSIQVKLFVNNLTRARYLTSASVYSGNRAVADFNDPRTFGIRLSKNF